MREIATICLVPEFDKELHIVKYFCEKNVSRQDLSGSPGLETQPTM